MATITSSILDYIAKRGSENRVIDLATVFSGTGLAYSVKNGDRSVANAAIEGSKLVIDYADTLGYRSQDHGDGLRWSERDGQCPHPCRR